MFAQWPDVYHAFDVHSVEELRVDLKRYCQYDALPLTLIARVNGAVAATASLDKNDIPEPHPYAAAGPWVVSVYTLPQYRGKGSFDSPAASRLHHLLLSPGAHASRCVCRFGEPSDREHCIGGASRAAYAVGVAVHVRTRVSA